MIFKWQKQGTEQGAEKYISGKITKKLVASGEGDGEPGLGAEAFIFSQLVYFSICVFQNNV